MAMSEARAVYEAAMDKSYGEFRERVSTAYQVMADQADKAWYDYQVSIERERNEEASNAEDGDDRSADTTGRSGRHAGTGQEQPATGQDDDAQRSGSDEFSQDAGAAVP